MTLQNLFGLFSFSMVTDRFWVVLIKEQHLFLNHLESKQSLTMFATVFIRYKNYKHDQTLYWRMTVKKKRQNILKTVWFVHCSLNVVSLIAAALDLLLKPPARFWWRNDFCALFNVSSVPRQQKTRLLAAQLRQNGAKPWWKVDW